MHAQTNGARCVSVITALEMYSQIYIKLRRIFRAIQAIKMQSGWTWTDTRGADITPELESAWATFIKIYKDAKPFKNRGWVHLEKMTEIMPVTLRGTYVFRPSQGITGMGTAVQSPRSPSPDWDIENPDAELPLSDHDEDEGEASPPRKVSPTSVICS